MPKKVNNTIKLVVLHIVVEHPGIYLKEIQSKGSNISLSTICHLLQEQHFSREKLRLVARQRDELYGAVYAAEMALYSPDMFIFLEETGSDRRNALRKYGYSFRGVPAVSHKLLIRGQLLSTIACISMEGILEYKTVQTSVDGDTFYSVQLLPLLMPFNGINPHSVVVMDNAGISGLITEAGALLIYLPPYSPDFNPIEEAFSKVKTHTKTYEQELDLSSTDLQDIILLSFTQITPNDCYNLIDHCGIYT